VPGGADDQRAADGQAEVGHDGQLGHEQDADDDRQPVEGCLDPGPPAPRQQPRERSLLGRAREDELWPTMPPRPAETRGRARLRTVPPMRQLADGVWQLSGFPPNAINVYVLGDVLIDSGVPFDSRRVLGQIAGREIGAHALTHAHFDHYGSSHAVCARLGIPLWCGADDVEAVEAGKMVALGRMVPAAKAHPVARALREGDEVAGFTVLDTPGHSPGHVSYWRESDRVLVCGDVMWGFNPFTLSGAIREPYGFASPDPVLNRASARRLAELEPALVCFGHGPPLRDPAKFAAAVARLPR
jgi:hydroxyacylglutathione hydrolase